MEKKDIFIEKAKKVHDGENLDYSEVEYVNNRTPVKMNDLIIDGYVKKAVSKDGKFETYDYLNKSGKLSEYVEKVLGINLPSSYKRRNQYKKTGKYWYEDYFDIVLEKKKDTKKCPYCGWETFDKENRTGAFEVHLRREHNKSKEDYISEFPNELSYFRLANPSLDRQFETNPDKFITCQICGKKLSSIDSRHLEKHGISKRDYMLKFGVLKTTCKELHEKLSSGATITNENMEYNFSSEPEKELCDYINSFGIKCEKDRKILHGKEIDMYIPDYKIAIEFDGNKYHTEKYGGKDKYYHLNKTLDCKKAGITLIHVFEDEYMLHKDIVESKIRHMLKLDDNLAKIPGRKCHVHDIPKSMAFDFLNKYHIQGAVSSSAYLGAFYDNILVAVMTFKVSRKNSLIWELNRFASDYNFILQGVGGKLFNYFVKKYNPEEVKSFLDRRWCSSETSNIYTKLGFDFEKYTLPEYRYYNSSVDRYKRFHKFLFRKTILHRKYNFPLYMTEKEMTENLGYDKIWDCGLIKYVWRNKKAQA